MDTKGRTIGDKMRFIRVCKGYTQKEMAIKLGLAPHYYNSIECNISQPGIKTIRKFAELTKTPIKELI